MSHPVLRKYVRRSANGKQVLLDRDRVARERWLAGVKVIRSTLTDLAPLVSLATQLEQGDTRYWVRGEYPTEASVVLEKLEAEPGAATWGAERIGREGRLPAGRQGEVVGAGPRSRTDEQASDGLAARVAVL